jgi:branched-chain amino acid transport system ATP-binding protein
MLAIRNVSVAFGGVKALQDVSFTVASGTVHAVIGPNGAGKTTLFNLITGVYKPHSGSILLDGEDVTGLAPDQLARRGACRTFQNLQICMNMSARENVMLGAHLRLNRSALAAMLGWPSIRHGDAQCQADADALMDFAGVGSYRTAHVTEMSFGALKRLEIARALASQPKLLLLDEPAAGLNHTETGEIATLIQDIAAKGVTVLLVEHDMKLVMKVSGRIVVLDSGRKLAEGTPAEIRSNESVLSAYLGVAA